MAVQYLPHAVDTVIVGAGPSALILSFILHGNIPHYNASTPHPDPILQKKLLPLNSLLDIDVCDLTAHFGASRLSYSTQALPINVLLDTLLRPLADTNPGEYESCVCWRHDPSRRVPHVVLGNTSKPGGQWADNPIAGSSDVAALSYAEMLSLPGYSFERHCEVAHGSELGAFHRPTRREVAEYLEVYPGVVGITDSIFTDVNVDSISRTENGFHIGSHDIRCSHLVLASGVFSNLIPPRPLLMPLIDALPRPPTSKLPILVIGSGFTAADVILSFPPDRKVIHIFKWTAERPSPLQACHPRAYPEYASVYRRMKLAASNLLGSQTVRLPLKTRKSNPFFDQRDWDGVYEGFPNTLVHDVSLYGDRARITLQCHDGTLVQREISGLEYVIGRRGSLTYLDTSLQKEIFHSSQTPHVAAARISSRTLRPKMEDNLEIAPDIFAIGSLTGDSLIRFAFGGCIFAACEILNRVGQPNDTPPETNPSTPKILFSFIHDKECRAREQR